MSDDISTLERRIAKVEEWKNAEAVRRAEEAMRVTHIDEKFAELKTELKKDIDAVSASVENMNTTVKSNFTWLVRTVLGAGIVAFVGFALAGGGLAPFTGG